MKRQQLTRRLPGGAIVALHHGDHDQKTHGNRDGGESDRPKRTIQEASKIVDALPRHGDWDRDDPEGDDFAENVLPFAKASDAQLMREAAARWGEGKNAWDEHAVEMEVPVQKITTNQPYVARTNLKGMLGELGSDLKPIHLFKFRGEYVVWDGNHRVSAKSIMGVRNIRARVLDMDRVPRMQDIDKVPSVNFKVEPGHFLYVPPFEKSDIEDKIAKHHTPGGVDHDQKTHGNREGGSEEKGGAGRSKVSMVGRGPDRGVGGEEGARIMKQPSSAYKVQNATAGVDTQKMYEIGKNRYAPDRAALHNEQVRLQFVGKKPAEGQPTVIQVGGGSGAGKDRLLEDYAIGGMKDGKTADDWVLSNGDIHKSQYPEYGDKQQAGDFNGAPVHTHEEASYVSKEVINDAIDGGYNVIANQTGNNTYESIAAKVEGYRRHGARVVAHYVTCDVDKAVERAILRSKKPPFRSVEESTIRGTHRSVSQIVPRAMAEGLFDELTLYDSNGDGGRAKIIAHYKDGKITIHDRDAWERFEAKGR